MNGLYSAVILRSGGGNAFLSVWHVREGRRGRRPGAPSGGVESLRLCPTGQIEWNGRFSDDYTSSASTSKHSHIDSLFKCPGL